MLSLVTPQGPCDAYHRMGECTDEKCRLSHYPIVSDVPLLCHAHYQRYVTICKTCVVATKYYSKDGIHYYTDDELTKLIFTWDVKGEFAHKVKQSRYELKSTYESRKVYPKCFVYYNKARVYYNKYRLLRKICAVYDVLVIIMHLFIEPMRHTVNVEEIQLHSDYCLDESSHDQSDGEKDSIDNKVVSKEEIIHKKTSIVFDSDDEP